jgi:membrane protein implicated in regulation of membrane protease activity
MAWWIWMLLGLGLLGAETLLPGGFYFLFLGVGAMLVGLLAALGAVTSQPAQWLLFSVLSVASLLLVRRRLADRFSAAPARRDGIDTLRDEVAVVHQELPPGAVGKAELRGAIWNARNVGERPLRAGERCPVARVDGLTLLLRGE